MLSVLQIIENHHKENFSKLVKKYARPLGGYHAAEDVVQEAYYRAIKYSARWDSNQEFAPWFSIILRNAFRDQLNAERGIVFEPIDEFNFEQIDDTTRVDELKEAVRDQISKEREEAQLVLKLFFLAGYTGKEISEITTFSQTNVRQTVHQFKKKFLKSYTRHD